MFCIATETVFVSPTPMNAGMAVAVLDSSRSRYCCWLDPWQTLQLLVERAQVRGRETRSIISSSDAVTVFE